MLRPTQQGSLAKLSLIALVLALRAGAQSTLVGTVSSDSAGKHPLVGVAVAIPSLHKSSRTDSAGSYRIDSLALGHYTVLVRAVGYQPSVDSVSIDVADGTLYNVVLSALAQPLDTIRSKSKRVDYISPMLRRFEERRAEGFGQFLSEEELRKFDFAQLSTVLPRLPGLTLIRTGTRTIASSTRLGQQCPVSVYLDGIEMKDINARPRRGAAPTLPPSVDDYSVDQLAGVEFYAGEATAPPNYKRNPCGLLLLWTRER